MAVTFVRGKWTGNEAGKEINLVGAEKPAENNQLVIFCSDSGKTNKPKVADDKDGETGWVGSETSALGNESKGALWVFVKAKAKGTEEKITVTVVGTNNSVEYAEISGSTGEIDNIQAFNNVGGAVAVKEFTVEGVTTNQATSITFIGMANCAASSNGVAEAWTGGPPTMKNPETGVGRGYYGYEIPGSKIEGKTFTGKHATARKEVAVLAVSFKAAAGGVVEASAVLTLKDTFGASQPTAVSAIQTTLTLAGKFRAINEPTTEVGARVVLSVAEVLTAKEQQAQSASYTVTLTTALKGKAVATGGTPTVKRTIIFIIDE